MTHCNFDEENSNTSINPTFASVWSLRLSRRALLRGSAALTGSAVLGTGAGAVAHAAVPVTNPDSSPSKNSKNLENLEKLANLLGFDAVPKSVADTLVLPAGYSARIIYALGDPLRAGIATYKNDGTDTDFEHRAGDHHDGMEWFGLDANGQRCDSSVDRGLLGINHEATTNEQRPSFFVHANGGTNTLPRPASEIDKELAIHGVSVIEVRKTANTWAYVPDSALNFRLTPMTDIDLSGPARGNALMVTKYAPDGTRTRGTLNNCGTGKTPWGTLLTGEENWNGYFTRTATDDAARGNDQSVTALKRYGRAQGAASRHGWETGGSDANDDKYVRWNNSKTGTSTDGSDDYRNEMNAQGYVVEINPYNKTHKAKKRTALGRFAHEGAAFSNPVVGQPLAVYMGDDARNEYIYKWVSAAVWSAADANPSHPYDVMAVGDKYLDAGTLYVARFHADGTGDWVALNLHNAHIKGYTGYAFADQADVCVNTRLAADAVGATKMDRPEWCSVNPVNGEIYYTLTNNNTRTVNPSGRSQLVPDCANPRAYTDMKGSSAQTGNPNGHIVRIKEGADGAGASAFTWDVYAFGAQADADMNTVNLSGLTHDQDFSSPDGIKFSAATGILWIQTDDKAYTDVTNCMMLAALPGQVGDGMKQTLHYTQANGNTVAVDTYVGQAPSTQTLKRFLVGPNESGITGIAETPDGTALFINIQHPGEGTKMAHIADPHQYTSQWPSNAGYGAGKRPRSATIVITKDDGGRIGS